MITKTESMFVWAFTLAAAIAVGVSAVGAALPPREPQPVISTLASTELPACAFGTCWR